MLALLLKVWGLAKPHRTRMFPGGLMGIPSGVVGGPLLITAIAFVYGILFPSAGALGSPAKPLPGAPAAGQDCLRRAPAAALDELLRDCTTLCTAHRLSTVLHADPIVMLDQGRTVETGKHDELIRPGGIYQKLYDLQFRE
jgi:hypothetical protein